MDIRDPSSVLHTFRIDNFLFPCPLTQRYSLQMVFAGHRHRHLDQHQSTIQTYQESQILPSQSVYTVRHLANCPSFHPEESLPSWHQETLSSDSSSNAESATTVDLPTIHSDSLGSLVALVLAEAKAVEDVLGVHQVLHATFVMDRRHLPIDSASVETAAVALAILVDMVVH
jgi:hypothetical protein